MPQLYIIYYTFISPKSQYVLNIFSVPSLGHIPPCLYDTRQNRRRSVRFLSTYTIFGFPNYFLLTLFRKSDIILLQKHTTKLKKGDDARKMCHECGKYFCPPFCPEFMGNGNERKKDTLGSTEEYSPRSTAVLLTKANERKRRAYDGNGAIGRAKKLDR